MSVALLIALSQSVQAKDGVKVRPHVKPIISGQFYCGWRPLFWIECWWRSWCSVRSKTRG